MFSAINRLTERMRIRAGVRDVVDDVFAGHDAQEKEAVEKYCWAEHDPGGT